MYTRFRPDVSVCFTAVCQHDGMSTECVKSDRDSINTPHTPISLPNSWETSSVASLGRKKQHFPSMSSEFQTRPKFTMCF